MDQGVFIGKLLFYFKENLFGNFQSVVKEYISKFPSDPIYLMCNGFSFILCEKYLEGIREINAIQSSEEVSLALTMCLIHAHKRSTSPDKETLQYLESKLRDEKRNASSSALYYASMFLLFIEKYDKANDFIIKSIKLDSSTPHNTVLRGWIEVLRNKSSPSHKISPYFEDATVSDNFDAKLGLATLKYYQKNFTGAVDILDQMSQQFSESEIILAEKMRNELALYNWDSMHEIMNQLLSIQDDHLLAMKYKILYVICKKGDYIESAELLDQYYNILERQEKNNSHIFNDTTQLFSRVCGRSNSVLSQVYRFAKHAAELNPSNPNYLTELGYQCLMQGKMKDANHFFKSATKLDDSSVNALCGLTFCQMNENGPSEQVAQQIELLNELITSKVKNTYLLLMSAKIEQKSPETAMEYLNTAVETLISNVHNIPFGGEYLKTLNVDLLLLINEEYQRFIPKKPSVVTDSMMLFNFEEILPTSVTKSLYLLDLIVKSCPGLVQAIFEQARLQFLYGKVANAQKSAQNIIENIEPSYANVHLLLSQIYIQQNCFERAQQSLEACLSYNFKIRDNPLYHLLNGVIYKHQKKYKDALSCFTSALNLHGAKQLSNKTKSGIDIALNLPDKATLYLELINVYTEMGEYGEANKIMQEAVEEFSYTSEEARLQLANAEMALKNSEVDKAIEILAEIKPGQPYYLQAHTKLANIYLKEKNDRAMFSSCFKDIVVNHPGCDGHTMLGDAYMSILEPNMAVQAYEKALQQNPQDIALVKKMGIALVKMHHYDKAIRHYKETLRSLDNYELKIDLAELFIKLKQFENADELLSEELNTAAIVNANDVPTMKYKSKLLMMLAKVKEKRGLHEAGPRGALAILKEAKDNQTRLVKRAQIDGYDNLDEEKKILSDICYSLASLFAGSKSTDLAIHTYKEALQYTPQNPVVLLALAKLYTQINEPDLCQQTCSILLSADPENEAASVTMADLAFRKVDFEKAAFHLKQLLTSQPAYWIALEKFIDAQRRMGKLDEVTPFITKAQEMGYSQDPGFLYCMGLKYRFSGDPNAALRLWGKARTQGQGGPWGKAAALGVIGVCLAPSGEPMPPPISEDGINDSTEDLEYRDTRSFALNMAERLLLELKKESDRNQSDLLELKLLEYRLTLAGRKKAEVEGALKSLLQMASEDGGADDVGIAVTLSTAYLVLKQTQRARNCLKRVCRTPWSPERAHTLETCWLLLADCLLLAGGSSIDPAREMLDKALKHNRSCASAHEYLGHLAEKDQSFKQAAKHYESAWEFGGRTNTSIGYKYAYSLLKAKKYAEAIAVSREVLNVQPDFPKLRREVFEKAITHLRC